MEKIFANEVIKVAVLGPESSGKTSLCEFLSYYYKTLFVPEFARIYLEAKAEFSYTPEEIEFMAINQKKIEEEYVQKANKILFCDTEVIYYKVWLREKFKLSSEKIENWLKSIDYHYYLLTYPDLEWQDDSLRENKDRTQELFSIYENEVSKTKIPYAIVSGKEKERFSNAIGIISTIS